MGPRWLLALAGLWAGVALGAPADCEFWESECGWSWSDGFALLSAENTSLLGSTAPAHDTQNNVKGQFLYYSTSKSGVKTQLEIISPPLESNTLSTCTLVLAMHMFQMDMAVFKLVIRARNHSWESNSFPGNSAHRWEIHKEPIGVVSQPFRVILEIIDSISAAPSHIAVDDIKLVNCYSKKHYTTDCNPRQFQCSELICIEAHEVCDATPDCHEGEDEEQECDKIPESAFCTFETGTCGWNNTETDNSQWILYSGDSPNPRTGPSFDHTYKNDTGVYLLAKFPSGRNFGKQTTFSSPWFGPPPVYHRNVHSAYYNSCQVRFFYHKYGKNMGDLRLYSVEYDPKTKSRANELWRSFGGKGDKWLPAVVTLPNISHRYQLHFTASRGVGHSDIAIDDVTLSPECFGIGVPINESINIPDDSGSETGEVTEKPLSQIKKFLFGTCGAKGRLGPNETACTAAYQNSSTRVTVLTEPSMEGTQRWTVPSTGLYTMFVRGAGGGSGVDNRGTSFGTALRATFEWKQGDVIYFLIGQKGMDACSSLLTACEPVVAKRSIGVIKEMNRMREEGGGGGGGGATYVYKMDTETYSKTPIAIAAGGGGLSAKIKDDENFINIMPHGLSINNTVFPINGETGSAGGGGGWDDTTNHVSSGQSLREGGKGGEVCRRAKVWDTNGGFGGGGGGCATGGGGGGYRGGDASLDESPYFNGHGGTSYLMPGAIRSLVEPGSNPGDGSVVIVPAQSGCGCEYLCVILDLESMGYYCICPPHLTINPIDGFSCNGYSSNTIGISPKLLALIILSGVITVSGITICIFFTTARYRKVQHSRDASHEPLNNPEVQLSRLRTTGGMVTEYNPNYEFGGSTCTLQDLKDIPREQLTLVRALGQGAFGEVYEGYLTIPNCDTEKPVAVKTLPELSSSQAEMDFLMEALIMSKFNHPNIVSFIGVCFDKMPRFIVLELLPGGDLKSFLRECRPRPDTPPTITIADLLLLALDVAKGCQYLEENHFIHRDIAARNCLLTTKDANRVVKIADFGMARDIYRADYYRKGGKAMLPVKWMPPEAFLDGIFTSKTDVWSFGVLLWEVISLGYMPYPGRGNQEVMQLVTSGGRLEPPTNCPGPVYHIMTQCWLPHPDDRPHFTTIIERLGYCLQDPDVINATLPVFDRAPSMERDLTIMRPSDDDSVGCLQVQRPEAPFLTSPGSEDYLIPMPHSTYSITTERSDLQSSPSAGSSDQLLEMDERGNTPSARPTVWETNFMRPDAPKPNPSQWSEANSIHPNGKHQRGYMEVPTDEPEETSSVRASNSIRKSSIRSLDDLPMAPMIACANENAIQENPIPTPKNKSNLSLDASTLGAEANHVPNRYINVDVNFNTGDSNRTGLVNENSVNGPYDDYAGVNPVA